MRLVRRYREAADNIVWNMTAQLELRGKVGIRSRSSLGIELMPPLLSIRSDRRGLSSQTFQHGVRCPSTRGFVFCIENSPTQWEVVPSIGDAREFLPDIERDFLAEASDKFLFGILLSHSFTC